MQTKPYRASVHSITVSQVGSHAAGVGRTISRRAGRACVLLACALFAGCNTTADPVEHVKRLERTRDPHSVPTAEAGPTFADAAPKPGLQAEAGMPLKPDHESDAATPIPHEGGAAVDAGPDLGLAECVAPATSTASFTKKKLLGAAADCATFHACRFLNAAKVLEHSVLGYAETDGADERDLAQNAFAEAMDIWSRLELFQFGPLASKASDQYHGRGLRSLIHAWPANNRCQVETQVVTQGYDNGFGGITPGARGLFGLEYLLYHNGNDTGCFAGSKTEALWSLKSPTELTQGKLRYAKALALELRERAEELAQVWAPTGENFKQTLLDLKGYGSEQEALNVVAWALIYLERELKDLKVGIPAGVVVAPSNPETVFARLDVDNLRSNLRGFRALFQGCGANGAGVGFDDWLGAAGHDELANDLLTALSALDATAASFPPFHQASNAEFAALYEAVRRVSAPLKAEFFGSGSPLGLKLPASAASDTD